MATTLTPNAAAAVRRPVRRARPTAAEVLDAILHALATPDPGDDAEDRNVRDWADALLTSGERASGGGRGDANRRIVAAGPHGGPT